MSQPLERVSTLVRPQEGFGRRSATFLGLRVSPEGLAVNESKIDAVAKLAPPSSVLQVRQFLGLAGYYRSFIPSFAEIARPLFKLTRHNARALVQTQLEPRRAQPGEDAAQLQ